MALYRNGSPRGLSRRSSLPLGCVLAATITLGIIALNYGGSGTMLRSGYYDQKPPTSFSKRQQPGAVCMQAMQHYFPGAVSGDVTNNCMKTLMRKFGVYPEKTLLGISTCPDEINRLMDRFTDQWGYNFPLSGLAGVPFTGKTGFGAYGSHAPDGGAVLIFFAPHIGLSEVGELGKVKRLGVGKHSGACGSLLAAIAAVEKKRSAQNHEQQPPPADDPLDYQQKHVRWNSTYLFSETAPLYTKGQVVEIIDQHWEEIKDSPNRLRAATEIVYQVIKWRLIACIPVDFPKPVGLIGGIQINTDKEDGSSGVDYFQPKDVLFRRGPNREFTEKTLEFQRLAASDEEADANMYKMPLRGQTPQMSPHGSQTPAIDH
eukprot:jgi/Bigna1/89890/estExt_fgenesh1_pg.C_570075